MFTTSGQNIAWPLVVDAVAAVAILALLAWRAPYLARIGLRNVGRRRLRTALIIFGLMLSTSFVAMSLAVDDTVTLAVKTVAVFNLGRVDEDIVAHGWAPQMFDAHIGDTVANALGTTPHVAGVAPVLLTPNILVADETQRQVRGGVTAIGFDPSHAGPLGALRTARGVPAPAGALAPNQLYLNRGLAQLLFARPGDTITLYSEHWPGKRYRFTVRDIVTGGVVGDPSAIVLPLPVLQQLLDVSGKVNHIYVANAGDGLTGVGYSDEVRERLEDVLPGELHTITVKQNGVRFATAAEDIFGRILTLFTFFALFIGLLLIFLIFVLLVAERRAELGVVRALGLRRAHVVRMLLFEGAGYDLAAAAIGVLGGLGLGTLVVALVSPTIARIGFPLQISVEPQSVVIAFCLGLLFTLVTIWLAAWMASRMTIAAAMRDLPEPPPPRADFVTLLGSALHASGDVGREPTSALAAWGRVAAALVTSGVVPLVAGWWLARHAIGSLNALEFSLGLSCIVVGAVLALRTLALAVVGRVLRGRAGGGPVSALARATGLADRLSAVVMGGAIALYWSLPFDALARFGLSRFTGGIEVFFVAGVMMIFGTVWALAPNIDLALRPVGWALEGLGRLRHVLRIALVYPAHHRFRTGIGLSLFSLVCFVSVVMACIAASATQSFDTIPEQAAGYDIAAQPLFTPIGGLAQLHAALGNGSSGALANVDAISTATPLPFGIVETTATDARWRLYPVSQVNGAFLAGVGLPLAARATGYASDAAVWRDVRSHPGDVVIDAAALGPDDAAALAIQQPRPVSAAQFIAPPVAAGLPTITNLQTQNAQSKSPAAANDLLVQIAAAINDPDILAQNTLSLQHVVVGAGTIAPTTLWGIDLRGGPAIKLRVIGIVNNARGQRFGIFGSPATFAPAEAGLTPFGNEYYYFKVRSGADARATARSLGSALMDHGFETTVLQDALLNATGPSVFISRVIVGLAILTLLVGMAALAVTGSRAVIERRQQIGMLRALGFRRLHIQLIFLLESLLVGVAGTAIGLTLGLILCRNLFAVDFFERFRSGLTLVVPWSELSAICVAAVCASLLASVLPAWQAGRVAPADAIRFE